MGSSSNPRPLVRYGTSQRVENVPFQDREEGPKVLKDVLDNEMIFLHPLPCHLLEVVPGTRTTLHSPNIVHSSLRCKKPFTEQTAEGLLEAPDVALEAAQVTTAGLRPGFCDSHGQTQ